ncbi:hypothetical protein [Paenibacillus harenae]|uniref:Restriction endonuclease n=1 Tax=Paenibacillus harenae TaxID=306543 RepID=A0ABT9TYS6_PAEHA|nr:hypothetical protein [Paenibacillus harenae]MDQ0112458.1 hypothetical protein [Paenibacillus harenae]
MIDYEKDMNGFLKAKNEYESLREDERKGIKRYLSEKGFTVKTGGKEGRGSSAYTNSGKSKMKRSYDLTNWKWVEATKGSITYFISLQAFDRDTGSTNYHVLFDRIGVCAFSKEAKVNEKDYFNCMQVTSLELPLRENDLDELLIILNNMDILEKHQ